MRPIRAYLGYFVFCQVGWLFHFFQSDLCYGLSHLELWKP